MVTRHLVKLIAVNEQETPTIGGFVDEFVDHLDLAENDAAVVAQHLVVIARDEDHAVAMPCPAQQFLDDRVLRLRPVDTAAHRPEVDDVADQKSLLGGVFAQEIEESVRLARPRAKVDVGEKDGSDLGHERTIRPARDPEVTAGLRFCCGGY